MSELTKHALDQCLTRGFDPDEVLSAVQDHEREISRSDAWEVRVVVKVYPVSRYLPDGSNGDTVIACVNPRTLRITTVMLQRDSQVRRKDGTEAPYVGREVV